MDASQQDELEQVLVGYFGDRSRVEGMRELLTITSGHQEYRERYRRALESGVRAAQDGDPDVLRAVRRLSPFLPDLSAAAELLQELLAEWDRQLADQP